jgi:prepilin-type N-terminal cleavage/methylation domain-containing protein
LGETQIGRTPPGRKRAGFTLVEVIVVLVILAILAAIAIPALTGYIDKAEYQGVKSLGRTQLTAMQTMIHEQIERDGGIVTHTTASSNDVFGNVSSYYSIGYQFSLITAYGRQEYAKLTGDSQSFPPSVTMTPFIFTDLSGAIKVYCYFDDTYFGVAGKEFLIYYIANVDSTDDVTTKFLASTSVPNLESGFNVYSREGGVWTKLS